MQTKPIKNRTSGLPLILAGLLLLIAATLASAVRTRAIESSGVATPTPLPTRPRRVASLPEAAATPGLGPGASLHGKQLFPPGDPWNQDISNVPVDPNSARLIAAIGPDDRLHPDFGTVYRGAPNGIPYIVVSGSQPPARIN